MLFRSLISGGRLILGLGLGWRAEEFEGLGISPRGLGKRLEEIVETLRQAWSGGLVTAGGRNPGVSVTPKPPRPAGAPVWIGGSAEPAVRRAGRIANGFLSSRATKWKSSPATSLYARICSATCSGVPTRAPALSSSSSAGVSGGGAGMAPVLARAPAMSRYFQRM